MEKNQKFVLKIVMGVFVVMLLAAASFLVIAVTGDANSQQTTHVPTTSSSTPISEAEAIYAAQSVVSGGKLGDIERTTKDGVDVFAVEFDSDDIEVTVFVNVFTSAIEKIEREEELTPIQVSNANVKISLEQAKAIALTRVAGEVTEVEATDLDGTYIYEVEVTHGQYESDVIIDMNTGAILEIETDLAETDENDVDEDGESQDDEEQVSAQEYESAKKDITETQARQIAEDDTGGIAIEVDTDRFNGRIVYEVEVRVNGEEADVLIDFETGEVLDIEWE